VIYDTRSVGMGGAGVALVTSPAAIFQNTAGLGEIETTAISSTLTPYFIQLKYPWFSGTGQPKTTSSERSIGPLGFVGIGHRVHDRVVIGWGAFLTAGLGARYKSVEALGNRDAEMGAVAGEVQLPVAYQVNDDLNIGAAYRMSFAVHQMNMPRSDGQNPLSLLKTEMSTTGFDFSGFQLGILYKPTKSFRVGVNYRSPVVVTTEGDTKIDGATVAENTKVDYKLPHNLKLGAAFSALENRLIFATDFNYWMYSLSHKEYNWRDAVSLNFGAEYWMSDSVPLRIGSFIGRSATSEAATGPFVPSEGPTLGATIGSGLHFGPWDIDFGLVLLRGRSDIEIINPEGGAFDKKYEFSHNAAVGSLSVSYRL
jgi:long-chain fatty acid transport protein